jgi:tripartite-type tricarboxylate transporter receptor subunit TctC
VKKLLGIALLAFAGPCLAQYPEKPILLIMPLQAGSAVDVMVRIVAQRMSENMGRPIVMENQPGAAGAIGAERVKRAPPDGYTLGVMNDGILTMVPNVRQAPFDPVKDFAPIGLVASITWVLVASNDVPAKSVQELIALAKSQPGRLNYSSGGNASAQHVAMEAFKAAAGVDLTHVPYKGATQATTDVITNQVQAHFGALSIALPHIRAGKLRALGVPSTERSPLLPNLPTVSEAGVPGFQWHTWAALLAPAGTPQPIVDRLNAELVKAVNAPDVRQKLVDQALEPIGSKPAMVTEWTQSGLKRMRALIDRAGIKPE